jgi:hypothetical protein
VRNGLRLVRGGVLGGRAGPEQRPRRWRRCSDAQREHQAGNAPDQPGAIMWGFTDAEPWHLVVANGDNASSRAARTRR